MRPSLLVCLPVRGQATASAAVRVILDDHPEAHVVVYHNYVEEPPAEVCRDLAHLPPGVTLVEERVPATMTIGAIRNRVTELGLSLHQPFALASADADITGFLRPGYYGRALEALQDADATATRRYLELAGLEGNVNLLLLAILSNAQSYLRSRIPVATSMVGAGSVFRAESFPGYPEVPLGEDLAMAERVQRILTLHDEGVYCDCRKQLSNLDEHYDRWPELVNLPPASLLPADRLLDGGARIVTGWVNAMFSLAIRVTSRSHPDTAAELQREAIIFHERLQILALRLPGAAPTERLDLVADFRRSPLGYFPTPVSRLPSAL